MERINSDNPVWIFGDDNRENSYSYRFNYTAYPVNDKPNRISLNTLN